MIYVDTFSKKDERKQILLFLCFECLRIEMISWFETQRRIYKIPNSEAFSQSLCPNWIAMFAKRFLHKAVHHSQVIATSFSVFVSFVSQKCFCTKKFRKFRLRWCFLWPRVSVFAVNFKYFSSKMVPSIFFFFFFFPIGGCALKILKGFTVWFWLRFPNQYRKWIEELIIELLFDDFD